jgi:hypothetical protein
LKDAVLAAAKPLKISGHAKRFVAAVEAEPRGWARFATAEDAVLAMVVFASMVGRRVM